MPAASLPTADPVDRVRDALLNLQFGTITLTVHGGVVVQLDRTERVRFSAPTGS